MTHCVNQDIINRLFSKFANRYGKIWTTRLGVNGDWSACAEDWLEELSQFEIPVLRQAVLDAFALHKEFPPTLGQLVDLCFKVTGCPDLDQVIKRMVIKQFDHPLVKMVYDKVGSWTISKATEKELHDKAKYAYDQVVTQFRQQPETAWAQLEDYKAKPKELPQPPKIPKDEEMKAFRECMNKCQEILQSKKIAGGGKTYKEFDANKIKKGHKDFEPAVFEEYKSYLMSIPETETMILPPVYLLDRNKFLNRRDQAEWLKKSGFVPLNEREGQDAPKNSNRNGRPTKMYKTWVND